MIKLTKLVQPAILEKNGQKWAQELIKMISEGRDPTSYQLGHYRHPEIKDTLKRETHEKCAYCESKHLHVSFGDVEHIVPKATRPDLRFEWDNLTLACTSCNNRKGENEGFVDPYRDDIDQHVSFVGPMLFGRPGSAKGEITERLLGLNRVELLEKRRERLDNLLNQMRRLEETQDERIRELLLKTLINSELEDEREYAACARKFISDMDIAL